MKIFFLGMLTAWFIFGTIYFFMALSHKFRCSVDDIDEYLGFLNGVIGIWWIVPAGIICNIIEDRKSKKLGKVNKLN